MGMGSNFQYKRSQQDLNKRAEEKHERKRLKRAKKRAEKERMGSDTNPVPSPEKS